MKIIRHSLWGTMAFGLLCCFAASGCASVVNFQFDVSLQTGYDAGDIVNGTASYDASGLLGVGTEYGPLTSFDFTLFGVSTTLADLNAGAQAALNNGSLTSFSANLAQSPQFFFSFDANGPGTFVDSITLGHTLNGEPGSGTYTIISATAAPEPAAILACGLALISGFLFWWRRPGRTSLHSQS